MMYRAILNDSPEDIRYALSAGASLDLGTAIGLARYRAIKTLLECGAVVDLCHVEKAMVLGDIKSALLLINHIPINADISRELRRWKKDNKGIFEYAVTEIDPMGIKDVVLEFMQAIIDHGYNINSSNHQSHQVNNEWTEHASAWVSALQSPHLSVEIFELLMKNGADPNQPIRGGGYIAVHPLVLAIANNDIKAVKYLLAAGANVNEGVVWSGRNLSQIQGTALSCARRLKHIDNHELIMLLLKHGAR